MRTHKLAFASALVLSLSLVGYAQGKDKTLGMKNSTDSGTMHRANAEMQKVLMKFDQF